MPLPTWLYRPKENTCEQSTSTMAGGFSARNLLKGTNPFSAHIPSIVNHDREKKRVIINDYSIPHVNGEDLAYMLEAIWLLLMNDFNTFLFIDDKLTLLNKDPGINFLKQIKKLSCVTAQKAAALDPDYNEDGTVLLNYQKMRELILYTAKKQLDFDINLPLEKQARQNIFISILIPYLEKNPSKAGLDVILESPPEIYLSDRTMHDVESTLEEYPALKPYMGHIYQAATYTAATPSVLMHYIENYPLIALRIKGLVIPSAPDIEDLNALFTEHTDSDQKHAVAKIATFPLAAAQAQRVRELFSDNIKLHIIAKDNTKNNGSFFYSFRASLDRNITEFDRFWRIKANDEDTEAHIGAKIIQHEKNLCPTFFKGSLAVFDTIYNAEPMNMVTSLCLTFDSCFFDEISSNMIYERITSLKLTFETLPNEQEMNRVIDMFPMLQQFTIENVEMSSNNDILITADIINHIYGFIKNKHANTRQKRLLESSVSILAERMIKQISSKMESLDGLDGLDDSDTEHIEDCLQLALEKMDSIVSFPDAMNEPSKDIIYASSNLPAKTTGFTAESAESQQYIMHPVCKILNSSRKMSIRKYLFTSVFDPLKQHYIDTIVKPNFINIPPESESLEPTHAMTDRTSDFSFDENTNTWYHRLLGFTQHDRLIVNTLTASKGNFTLKYSISDHMYYVVSSAKPENDIIFQYYLHVPNENINISDNSLAQHFQVEYQKDNRNNTHRSAEDCFKNPQYYSCIERTITFLSKYGTSHKFYGVSSGSHAWVENHNGMIDLGGVPAEMIYVNNLEAQENPNQNQPIHIPRKEIATPKEFMDKIALEKTNTLFLFDSPEALERARAAIIMQKGASILVIDGPNDLKMKSTFFSVTSDHPSLVNQNGGIIAKELKNNANTSLLIDWSNFMGRELPMHNTWIGAPENRHISHQSIPHHYHVIGLALINSAAATDASHKSRHKGNIFVVHESAIPKQTPANNTSTPVVIDLYGSPQWFDMLVGEIGILEGKFTCVKGKLLTQTIQSLIIKNPPKNDQEFSRFILHIQHGLPFSFYDKQIRFTNRITVEIQNGHDFSKYSGLIAKIVTNVSDESPLLAEDFQVINPATFDRILHEVYIDSHQNLQKKQGWLENGARIFYLTRSLPDHQLCAMLDKANELNKRNSFQLTLLCAPGVVIPPTLMALFPVEHHIASASPPEPISKNEKTYNYIVNLTGRNPDHLLYGMEACLDGNNITFKEIESDLWKALKQAKTICFTGECSEELIDHLATLLLANPYLWIHGKKEYFHGKIFLSLSSDKQNLSWIKRSGVFVTHPLKLERPLRIEALSTSDRLSTLEHVFNTQPAALIVGKPGIGKSYFIRSLMQNPSYSVFSEDKLISFLETEPKPGGTSIVVFDEADKRNTDFTVFEGLYAARKYLLIGARLYEVADNKKFIFLCNETKRMPSLFQRVATIKFHPFDFVINQVLQPILRDKEKSISFYAQHHSRPLREIHDAAITQCAKENPKHAFIPIVLNQFELTDSRVSIVYKVITCLNNRHYRTIAQCDTGKYGGQAGLWLEGPSGIGKTDLLRSILDTLGYRPITDYIILPANTPADELLSMLREAFDQGKIALIDELDTALTDPIIAHLNAFLMGEDLSFARPKTPGFMLLATGNGPTYPGRIILPDSLKSRLNCTRLDQYTEEEGRKILHARFKTQCQNDPDFKSVIETHLDYYLTHPKEFSFREVCDWLSQDGHPDLPRKGYVSSENSTSQCTQKVVAHAYDPDADFNELALSLLEEAEDEQRAAALLNMTLEEDGSVLADPTNAVFLINM